MSHITPALAQHRLIAADPPLQDARFLMLQTLGHGGMASVYRAFDRVEQRLVALKVQREAEPAGPDHSLCTEFEAWSRFSHPHIVRAYELQHAKCGPLPAGSPYLVLEHVDDDASGHEPSSGPEAPAVIESIGVQLLRALERVHAEGFVHRDVKPANVLVSGRDRQVKLTDFGLAARSGIREEPGKVSGSLPYVSPESLLGAALDARSDLYSLGILMYRLATGSLPLPRASAEQLVRWHLFGPPVELHRDGSRLPGRLARFIDRLCARDREARPASCAEALSDLGLPATSSTPGVRPGRAELAELRLALDAVRRGERRLIRVNCERSAPGLLHEARVWSRLRGIGCYRVGPARAGSEGGLERLILRLALEGGERARMLLRRHGLDGRPGIELFPPSGCVDDPAGAACSPQETARRLGLFLSDWSREQPVVLSIEQGSGAGPVERALRRRLVASIGAARSAASRGGLLLLLHDPIERG